MAEQLAAGLVVHKALIGPDCTLMELAGASITVLHLDGALAALIDHPCDGAMYEMG